MKRLPRSCWIPPYSVVLIRMSHILIDPSTGDNIQRNLFPPQPNMGTLDDASLVCNHGGDNPRSTPKYACVTALTHTPTGGCELVCLRDSAATMIEE